MTTRSCAEEGFYSCIMNRRRIRTLHTLLKKRVKVRRQDMTALVTIDGGLKGTNEYRFLDATFVPILVPRRQDRKVATTKVMVLLSSVRHDCGLEHGRAGNSSRREMFANSCCYCSFRFTYITSILSTRSAIGVATRQKVDDAGGFRHSELVFGPHKRFPQTTTRTDVC